MSQISNIGGISPSSPSLPVAHTVTSSKEIHGYYAAILRGTQEIWSTTLPFTGSGKDQFDLTWNLDNMIPGDTYAIIGFRLENDQPVKTCECRGPAVNLAQSGVLSLL